MPKQRYIRDNFWVDPYIETLTIEAKLLFLYLLTNPLCNVAGIYEITKNRISLETGIKIQQVTKIIQKFVEDGKILIHKNWILIINFGKHQAINPKIEIGVKRILKALPNEIKALKGFDSLSYFTLLNFTLLNLSDTVSDSDESSTVGTIKIKDENYPLNSLNQ